jgi:capsule polysaccharide export protein KpsE/RkpR
LEVSTGFIEDNVECGGFLSSDVAAGVRRLVTDRPVNQEFGPSGEATEALEAKSSLEMEDRRRRVARLRLLWVNRRFILKAGACGLVLSAAIALLIPKCYESMTRLMPPDTDASSSLAMVAALSARTGGFGAFAGDLLGLKSSGALFVGILKSRTVQDRLVELFDLRKAYGKRRIEDARAALEENTRISEDRRSGVITITITDSEPHIATEMAKAYVTELNRVVAEVTTSSARREREFLEKRLQVMKQELDESSADFSRFASENATIDISEQGRAMVEAAATLQGQLIAAQSELEGLKQVYSDNNVRVRAAQARISELRNQLEKLGGKESEEADEPAAEESLYPSIRQLPLLGVTYADLFRKTKIAEVVYELLTQQYELARVQEAKEIPTVKVLDLPVVPEKESFPPRLSIMFVGTFLALAGSVVWVVGRGRWDQLTPNDPGKLLAREVLQTVNRNMAWVPPNALRFQVMAHKLWTAVFRRGAGSRSVEGSESSL